MIKDTQIANINQIIVLISFLLNEEGLVIKRTTLVPTLGLMTSPLDNIMILLLGMNVKYYLDVIRLN